jgi:negative regulator of sigma E activity
MTEQINDQISAFIDDELSEGESAMLVRRFEREPEARAQALRYTLIGSALRGELLEPHPAVLRQRIAAALAGVPPAVARAPAPARWSARVARPLLGFGIAATVAVAAIGLLRAVNEAEPTANRTAAAPVPVAAPLQARDAAAPSYVVPPEVAEGRVMTPPIRLTNYLMHHMEYASRLSRTSVRSNVVSAATEPQPAAASEDVRQ